MKRFALAEVIVNLGDGLVGDSSKERLAEGIQLIHDTRVENFDPGLINKIVMPVFTRTIYNRHRFDIDVGQYVDLLIDSVVEMIRPTSDGKITLRDGTRLIFQRGHIDQEASWMEEITELFMRYVDITTPV